MIDTPKTTNAVEPQEEYWNCFTLTLSKGFYTLIDTEDFDYLAQWKWYAKKHVSGKWYAARAVRTAGKKSHVYIHRDLLGNPDGMVVDHRNGKTYDNRRENLRRCTARQNAFNNRADNRKSNPYRGVHWHKQSQQWVCKIQFDGKKIHLGVFSSPEDAARAWDRTVVKLRGEFAVLNFPGETSPPDTGR